MTNETINKILNELKRVERIIINIRDTGKASDIERDIIKSKLRTMYEFIQFIQPEADEEVSQKVYQPKVIPDYIPTPTIIPQIQTTEKVIPEVEKIIELIPESKPAVAPVVTKPEQPVEKVIKEEPAIVIKQEEPKVVKQEEPKVVNKPESKAKTEILAEKFETKSFLHETLSQYQNTDDLSKKFQHTPLKDIFSAISLNDRFLFIKELFNNDAVLFQQTIERLNNSGGFNESVKYLDSQFHWDFSESMVQKLLDLIHRRYLSNE